MVQRIRGFAGLELCVSAAGPAQGQPVLLLHGGGQTRHAWHETSNALAARGYYVAAMDLRGHGESEWSGTNDYSLAAQVGDVVAVIATLSSCPAVIGASMGGLIAMCTAGQHPDLVRALVLVDITPQVDRKGRARILDFMHSRPDGFSSLDEVADAIAAYSPHRPRPRNLTGLRRNLRLRDGRYYWHWDPDFVASYEPDPDAAEVRYTEAARSVRAPTLLLRGERSELVTADNVRHFQQLIAHAEFVDVQDAAHMIAGDQNDAFSSAVLEFLARACPVA